MTMKFKDLLKLAYSSKYLLTTNTVTMCSIYGLADVVVQLIENDTTDLKTVQFNRTLRVSSIGLLHGPMNHYWYKFLDSRVISGSAGLVVSKKVAVDLSVSPLFTASFIGGIAYLEGQSILDSLQEYKQKFFQVLTLDLCVWPPAQSINFFFLPPSFRVLYVSFVVLIYTCFLTWIKHLPALDQNHKIKSAIDLKEL